MSTNGGWSSLLKPGGFLQPFIYLARSFTLFRSYSINFPTCFPFFPADKFYPLTHSIRYSFESAGIYIMSRQVFFPQGFLIILINLIKKYTLSLSFSFPLYIFFLMGFQCGAFNKTLIRVTIICLYK